MSTKKTDISQLHKYLKGELDTRAMHQFERETQDDPFLMDAFDGYEALGSDQQVNLAELQKRLAKRIAPKKERNIILWRLLPIAACFLIAVGYWYFTTKPNKQQLANIVTANKRKQPVVQHPLTEQLITKQAIPVRHSVATTIRKRPAITAPQNSDLVASAVRVTPDNKIIYKGMGAEYRADDYKVPANATVDDLLRRMEGKVDSNGAIAKAKVNGKDYPVGNAVQVAKNLPADIIAKTQTIDSYGNQADKANSSLQNIGHGDTGVLIGKVVDEQGTPLPGVVVKAKNDPSTVTTTDVQGNYKLPLLDNKALLVYTFTGFDTQEVSAAGKKIINTTMTPSNTGLNEVVVVAYGTQKKSVVTAQVPAKKDTINAKKGSQSLLKEIDIRGATPKNIAIKKAQPVEGWKKYQAYIDQNAVMPDGTTGNVKLAFMITADGTVYNVHTVNGRNNATDQVAINLIKNGPKWMPGTESNEVSLKVKFHKKN